MNFSFKIDEVSKFSFRNEVPILKNKEYIPIPEAALFADAISGEVSDTRFISFNDYFMEE